MLSVARIVRRRRGWYEREPRHKRAQRRLTTDAMPSMSIGAITLADVAARTDVLVVSCSRCYRVVGRWLFERQRAGESRLPNAGPGGQVDR
jgi:hypothetical protein